MFGTDSSGAHPCCGSTQQEGGRLYLGTARGIYMFKKPFKSLQNLLISLIPREDVDSLSLEVLQAGLDKAWSNLV